MTRTDWWRGGAIYQIYPRSFQDSNGDGIGDLAGITQRLDYVADLGVDGIWISPFFKSPMLDFGYDVSDYRVVDPMFGSLADFDALIARAHALGLKVLIDLVLSHTSERHPWFEQSRASRDNPRADWYVWADPKPDGTPPNNWLSIFGGSAWEWSGERMQYYLHNFLTAQPDLNFHCRAVQDALLDVARFWLDRGVDGFRLDTVNFYVHDAQLRDNPALAEDQRNADTAPAVNPYNFQDHLYDKTRPENLDFLRRLRAVTDEYDAITTVGEVGESQRGMQVQADYTAGDDLLHMCYGFDFLAPDRPSMARVAQVLERFDREAPDSWACWAFSNHDVVRHVTRWNLGPEALKLYAALLMSVRGSICLYQGEELGLPEAEIAFDDLQDPYGKRFWPKFKGRDGCRTPMPWTRGNTHAGFSEARPWLPIPPAHLERTADTEPDPLAFYKAMLRYRSARPALRQGDLRVTKAVADVLAFTRDGAVLCAFNAGADAVRVPVPEGMWKPDTAAPFQTVIEDGHLMLAPMSAGFAIRGE